MAPILPVTRTVPQSPDIAVVSALTQSVGTPARQDLDSVLGAVDAALGQEVANRESSVASLVAPLRLTATGSNTIVSIASSFSSRSDGTQIRLPNGSMMSDFIGGTINFSSGAVTGNINAFSVISFSGEAGKFSKYELSLGSTSPNFVTVTPGSSFYSTLAAALADNTQPAFGAGIAIGEVIVQDNGTGGTGTISNVLQADIIQFVLTGAPAAAPVSSSSGWIANVVAIPNGANSVSYNFASAMPDTSYIVLPTLQNTADVNPQFLQVIDVVKTTTGFTLKLNATTDTPNYSANFIIPSKTLTAAEFPIPNGSQSVTVPLGIPDNGGGYGLIAILQNLMDANPQFQALTVNSQVASQFVAALNSTTDSPNYSVVYLKMASVQKALGLGVSSMSFDVPVAYGNTNYAVVAMVSTTDVNPQFSSTLITTKTNSAVTVSLNQNTDSVNYKLTVYVISFA